MESYLQEMKQLLQQYFLLLNGKRPMKGNLDMASYNILTTNLLLKEETATAFGIRNRADTDYRDLRLRRIGIGVDVDSDIPLIVEAALNYHIVGKFKGNRSANFVTFHVQNYASPHVNNRANFALKCQKTGSPEATCFNFSAGFKDIGATAESIVEMQGIEGGTTAKVMEFHGWKPVFPKHAVNVPSSASDTGIKGQVAWDDNYLYLCVATNAWKRVAISTW